MQAGEDIAQPTGHPPSRALRFTRLLGATLSLSMLVVALLFLYGELHDLDSARLLASFAATGGSQIALAVLFTLLSYTILTGYDAAAVRYTRRSLPYRQTAVISFIAFAVSMNVGLTALSGAAIRYRLYSALGVKASDIARIALFTAVTFVLGSTALIGVAMLFSSAGHEMLRLPEGLGRAVGVALLMVPILYLAMAYLGRARVRFGLWELAVPEFRIAAAQVALASADLLCASVVLYVLIEQVAGVDYPTFLAIYLVAMVAGLLSSVPGGVGVFEAVIIAALPRAQSAELIGPVILYRAIYYIAPLLLAVAAFGWQEVRQHAKALTGAAQRSASLVLSVTPLLAALVVFVAGVVLTVSGSMPGLESRIRLVADAIPLAILELSHLVGSLFGLGLLVLAHGLYRRLRSAYVASVCLLAGGIAASLLKGLQYEQAALLLGILALVWLSRKEFYRIGSIGHGQLTWPWIIAILSVLLVAVWAGFVSYRHVEYRDMLWWQFSVDSGASRMLRSTFLISVAALAFALYRLLRSQITPAWPDTASVDYDRVEAVIGTSEDSSANVALLGDKRFLWSNDGSAFIMYQVSGRSWIALGSPVGNVDAFDELAWRFVELVDRHEGRAVFYEVGETFLPICIDLGLSLSKLGEDARVRLADFSLDGSARGDLRQALNRARRSGATFHIVPRAEVPGVLAQLQRVSDSWLEDKAATEKGFSLGAFDEAYLSRFDCAVVRVGEEIVAFANLWLTASRQEASIDLMRYSNDAPKGIMDYLFVELLLWSKAQGYAWFSLGMAPLSGLEAHPLAPLWHKVGTLVFRHGESFYDFEGLRRYKEKFQPEWEPRYLACPPGSFNLATALFDASLLISSSVRHLPGKTAGRSGR